MPLRHALRACAVALTLLAWPAAALAGGAFGWEEAEAAGMRIGAVRVVRDDVFDPARPDEAHLVGRIANFIHITTNERLVRGALLIAPGEPVAAALVRESERRLRALPWLIDAAIEPAPAGPGLVDAVVRTHDGWSLSLSLKYNHAGGDDLWRVWVEEQNLLGWGKEIRVSRERDLERDTTEISYKDPFLLGSAWRLELAAQELSDGSGLRALAQLPFVRLDSPWSAGIEASERELVETLYDDASAVYVFPARLREGRAFVSRLVRFEERTAWRVGLEYRLREADYGALAVERAGALPPPRLDRRELRGLLLTGEVSQDRHRTGVNLRTMGCTEDVNLGWEASAAVGWSGPAFGGADEALLAEATLQAGRRLGAEALVVARAAGSGRLEDGVLRDALGTARATLYAPGLPWQTLALDVDFAAGARLDPERLLYLGGFEGLRGYPNHFRAGESRWTLTAEDRVITPWRLWGIAQVGFVLYADAGAIASAGGGWSRAYADLGAGLRFGNLKGTTSRVISLTLAVPLVREEGVSSWQIVAGNTIRF